MNRFSEQAALYARRQGRGHLGVAVLHAAHWPNGRGGKKLGAFDNCAAGAAVICIARGDFICATRVWREGTLNAVQFVAKFLVPGTARFLYTWRMVADTDSYLCIGLMSGTSMDGVDGVLLDIALPAASPAGGWRLRQRAFANTPMPAALKAELLALNTAGDNELHRAALAANALMRLYAQCVQTLCAQAHISPQQVAVIGAHGQTVRHRPCLFDDTGYTWQLMNGALLAELAGIVVACDFRSRDIAAGGQGAPLVPVFHQALWGRAEGTGAAATVDAADLAVLNLGGIANLSILQNGHGAQGFDCGPANALLDAWCQRHTGQPYDADGAWAAQGHVHAELLTQMLAEPFIQQMPPKSTGRDLYNMPWLAQQLARFSNLAPVDVQATLTAYTAQTAALHVRRFAPTANRLVVCGGGVRNGTLMRQLAQALPNVRVVSSQTLGVDPQTVEASAFAWLGLHTLLRLPLAMQAVTGARGARVLGCLYPA